MQNYPVGKELTNAQPVNRCSFFKKGVFSYYFIFNKLALIDNKNLIQRMAQFYSGGRFPYLADVSMIKEDIIF